MKLTLDEEDPDDERTEDAATDAITEAITDDGDTTSSARGAPAENTDDYRDDVDGLSEK